MGEERVELSWACARRILSPVRPALNFADYAAGRTRTDKGLPPWVFETHVYTSSTTAAKLVRGKSASLPRTKFRLFLLPSLSWWGTAQFW